MPLSDSVGTVSLPAHQGPGPHPLPPSPAHAAPPSFCPAADPLLQLLIVCPLSWHPPTPLGSFSFPGWLPSTLQCTPCGNEDQPACAGTSWAPGHWHGQRVSECFTPWSAWVRFGQWEASKLTSVVNFKPCRGPYLCWKYLTVHLQRVSSTPFRWSKALTPVVLVIGTRQPCVCQVLERHLVS